MKMEWWEKIAAIPFVIMALLLCYYIFVMIPMKLYAEAACLRNGYPRTYVTIGLERYCATLNGAITVRVDKVSQ